MTDTAAAPAPVSVFEACGVRFGYGRGGPDVLAGLDFDVAEGGFVGLVGPNGAGKSTLLNLLGGWLAPVAGTVEYRGRSVRAWPRAAFAARVAMVPQADDPAFDFTVLDMVLMGRHAAGGATGWGFASPRDLDAAGRAIDACCLSGFERRPFSRLSGGERRRVLLARALAAEPDTLLLDEPAAGLDLAHQRAMFETVAALNASSGVTVVAVMHDLGLAALYCREIAVLSRGRIVARGTPAETLTAERIESVYGVPVAVGHDIAGRPHVRLTR